MSTYLSDYDYFLPEELIGQKPREPRDSAKLMLIDRKTGSIEHKNFYNIIDYLQKGDVLVRNATKVIPARIFGHKDTGGVLEILLIKRITLDTWECLLKPAKKLKLGQKLYIGENKELIAELLEIKEDGKHVGWLKNVVVRFNNGESLDATFTLTYEVAYKRKGWDASTPTADVMYTRLDVKPEK